MNNCFKSSMDVGDMANYGAIVVGGNSHTFLGVELCVLSVGLIAGRATRDRFIEIGQDRRSMINTSNCALCGGKTLPAMKNGKMVEYKFRHVKPMLPPFNFYICLTCGHWQIFSLGVRNGPKKIPKDQIPEQDKMDLGLT